MTARRALAATAAAAFLTVLPAGAASAQSFLDPQDPCPVPAPPAPFTDRESIPEMHRLNVDCAAATGITRGQSAGAFNPGGIVTRGQMASFIVRTLEAGGHQLPAPSDQGFQDIGDSVHKDAINQLAALDITLGVTPTSYQPGAPVRRDQMASFVVRAAEFAYEGDELDGNTTMPFPFNDVPESNVHRANIAAAAELLGVSEGSTATTYDPAAGTTRAQMATFVIRLLDVTLIPQPLDLTSGVPVARTLRPFAVLGAALAVVLLGAAPAQAHPLGNFSVNTYSELVVTPDRVQVSVVVDRAEIPTRQDFPELDDRTGTLPGGTAAAAGEQCGTVAAGVALTVDGRPAALGVTDSALTFPPGAAGLRTARLVCVLHSEGSVPVVGTRVDYRLSPVSPAAGWRETTAVGDGVRLTGSSVPERSLSDALRAYPENRLASPLDVSTASFDVAAGTGVASGVSSVLGDAADAILPRGADRVTQAFTALVDRDRLTVPFAVFAVLVAALLGGLHAFAPGHGKTVMAACLVGRRGTVRDAVLLGGAVTVTHTAGVLVLGLVLSVLGLAQPQRAYPVLATASGLLLVGIGVVLLRSARRRAAVVPVRVAAPRPVLVAAGDAPAREQHHGHGNRDHDDHHAHDHDAHDHHAHDHDHHDHDHHDHDHHAHDHDHDHDHDHHGEHDHHDHDHDHHGAGTTTHAHGFGTHTHVVPSAGGGWRSLVAVGLAGGMVPSPSALIVLLGGIALGRAWFGLTLVVAYGLGMAVALAGTGLLLVQARGRLDRVLATAADGPVLRASRRAAATLPTATAGLVLVVGALLTVRAVAQL